MICLKARQIFRRFLGVTQHGRAAHSPSFRCAIRWRSAFRSLARDAARIPRRPMPGAACIAEPSATSTIFVVSTRGISEIKSTCVPVVKRHSQAMAHRQLKTLKTERLVDGRPAHNGLSSQADPLCADCEEKKGDIS